MSDSDSVYNEACRVVGECCLMLAQTGESNLAIKLAVEQLEDGLVK